MRAAGWNDPTSPARLAELVKPGAASGYNLLLITLDTTRPDYLGCYGRREARTPAIDALLSHGVRFDDAIAPVPLTLPSHASIITGLDPRHHGVRDNGKYFLPTEFTTLAEIYKAEGYDTAAFIACFVLDERFGLSQGFDTYDFKVSEEGRRGTESELNERPAGDVTNSVIQWLKGRQRTAEDRPFFAWVHYYDPHHPYASPMASLARFAGKPYDAEIAFMDSHIQRLFDALDQQNLRERTLVVVVSDHGESLYEHGESQHGLFIYDSTLSVALIFSCPTLFDAGYRVEDRVAGVVDILPTLQELMGLSPSVGLDGVSLLQARADDQRALYIENVSLQEALQCSPLFGLRRHTDKYILAPTPEYYDLRSDPGELRNRYAQNPAGLTALKRQLEEIGPQGAAASAGVAKRAMSDEERARLAALGYVAGGDVTPSDTPCDPKELIPRIKPFWEALELLQHEKYDQAETLLKEVIVQNEAYDLPVQLLGDLYLKQGRHQEALTLLEASASRRPTASLLVQMAVHLFKLRRYDQMEEKLLAAGILDPRRGSVPELRGDRCVEAQRYEAAVEQYEEALRIDGERLGQPVRDKLMRAREALQAIGR